MTYIECHLSLVQMLPMAEKPEREQLKSRVMILWLILMFLTLRTAKMMVIFPVQFLIAALAYSREKRNINICREVRKMKINLPMSYLPLLNDHDVFIVICTSTDCNKRFSTYKRRKSHTTNWSKVEDKLYLRL